ncbi:MAG: thioesterase [Lentimicrobiaceae bacterium]|nr:thioesterase [Lentimicrobiaceae bacterium]
MENLKPVWEDHYTVNWYEADPRSRASLVTILNYLQETAWRHACHLGFGFREGNEIKLAWVVIRHMIHIHRYPNWGEEVIAKTWPSGVDGLYALRDFEIFSLEGELLVSASSWWLIIDMKTRKTQSPEMIENVDSLVNMKKAIEETPPNLDVNGNFERIAMHTVNYTELDMYRHVNNSRYAEWLLNALPLEWHKTHSIREFVIEYLHECKLKDEITIEANFSTPDQFNFRGIRSKDDKMVFRVRIS